MEFIMVIETKKVSLVLVASLCLVSCFIFTASRIKNTNNAVIYLHEQEGVNRSGHALQKFIALGNTIVIFYEDWCSPCQRMAPIIQDCASKMSDIVFVKIKREFYRDLFKRYGLNTVPAILFFKDGQLMQVQPSSVTKKELRKLIKHIYAV